MPDFDLTFLQYIDPYRIDCIVIDFLIPCCSFRHNQSAAKYLRLSCGVLADFFPQGLAD